MADSPDISHLLDLPLEVEATLAGPALRVEEVLALEVGSVIPTRAPAGETVDIFVGGAYVGSGELGGVQGQTVVRMVRFRNRM